MLARLVTEFIGTFFLLLIISLALAAGLGTVTPVVIGTGLCVLVYMGGHISGAVYNPAVNLGLVAAGKMPLGTAGLYTAAQLAGGALGAVVGQGLTSRGFFPMPAKDLNGVYNTTSGMLAEGLFTGLLVLVILNVAKHPKLAGNQFYGVAIGGTVLVGAAAVGGISGGAFNPAVTIGAAVAQWSSRGEVAAGWMGQAIAAQLVAAIIAAVVFRVQERAPA